MRSRLHWVTGFGLLLAGFVAGQACVLSIPGVEAQDTKGKKAVPPQLVDLTEDCRDKIKKAADALSAAVEALSQEGRWKPATKNINVSAVFNGGISAKSDLESDNGVDPETFAALYADLATDDIAIDIARNERGLLTYKGKVVRMYSANRIRSMFSNRSLVTGEAKPPAIPDRPTDAPQKKAAAKAKDFSEDDESNDE
jgi:hypothetical protein